MLLPTTAEILHNTKFAEAFSKPVNFLKSILPGGNVSKKIITQPNSIATGAAPTPLQQIEPGVSVPPIDNLPKNPPLIVPKPFDYSQLILPIILIIGGIIIYKYYIKK